MGAAAPPKSAGEHRHEIEIVLGLPTGSDHGRDRCKIQPATFCQPTREPQGRRYFSFTYQRGWGWFNRLHGSLFKFCSGKKLERPEVFG